MFGIGLATKVYVAVGPTDMRKGFEGLYGLVRERLGVDPLSGRLSLFAVRAANTVKGGPCLCGRRRVLGVCANIWRGFFSLSRLRLSRCVRVWYCRPQGTGFVLERH